MELYSAVQILRTLALGTDPITGQALPDDSFCHNPKIIRALFLAVQEMERSIVNSGDGEMGRILANSMAKQAEVARQVKQGQA
jgi:hypothetical protein